MEILRPIAPFKPILPEKTYNKLKYIQIPNRASIRDILKLLPKVILTSEIFIKVNDGDDPISSSLLLEYTTVDSNLKYEEELIEYHKLMKLYEQRRQAYEIDLINYNNQTWKRKEIAKLEARLKELKGE